MYAITVSAAALQLPSEDVRESFFSFAMGQRGCTLLVFKGYNYVRNRRSGCKTYWICAKKGSTKCNARVVTDVVDEIATFSTGQRGCTVLMYGNQKFVKNRKSSTRTYWICSKKDVTWCRARVVTARDKHGTERILHRSFEHNHTRKYPRNEAGFQRTELLLKDFMSLRS